MRIPRTGELYLHFKNKLYQIVTIATHSETGEPLVIYQALYGDYSIYARPLEMFVSPVDKEKYPEVTQTYRFELYKPERDMPLADSVHLSNSQNEQSYNKEINQSYKKENYREEVSCTNQNEHYMPKEGEVSQLLLDFLDESSMGKRLELITSNMKYIDDRVINNMAVALDCAIADGPIEQRIQELLACLKAMSRFEDKRIR